MEPGEKLDVTGEISQWSDEDDDGNYVEGVAFRGRHLEEYVDSWLAESGYYDLDYLRKRVKVRLIIEVTSIEDRKGL